MRRLLLFTKPRKAGQSWDLRGLNGFHSQIPGKQGGRLQLRIQRLKPNQPVFSLTQVSPHPRGLETQVSELHPRVSGKPFPTTLGPACPVVSLESRLRHPSKTGVRSCGKCEHAEDWVSLLHLHPSPTIPGRDSRGRKLGKTQTVPGPGLWELRWMDPSPFPPHRQPGPPRR